MSNLTEINVMVQPVLPSWTSASFICVSPVVPLQPAALTIASRAGTLPVFSGTANNNGIISGTALSGEVDIETGVIIFAISAITSQPVNPANVLINGVGFVAQPTDPALLGLDGTRIPQNGKVLTIKPGDIALLHSTKIDNLATPQAGATVNLSRTDLAWAIVKDADSELVPTAAYTVDLADGTLTWADPLDLGDTTPPYTCHHRIQDLSTVVTVTAGGIVQLNLPITHDFLSTDSFLSTVLPTGTLQGRIEDVTSYQSWSGDFDELGDTEQTLYDNVQYPITIRNDWSVEDEWVVVFTTSQAYKVIGKQRGQLSTTGTINNNFSPVNPLTNLPFFTLKALGWRGGIIPGNFVYFKVRASSVPIQIARSVMPDRDDPIDDSIVIELIGDAIP